MTATSRTSTALRGTTWVSRTVIATAAGSARGSRWSAGTPGRWASPGSPPVRGPARRGGVRRCWRDVTCSGTMASLETVEPVLARRSPKDLVRTREGEGKAMNAVRGEPELAGGSRRLAVLLAMAMFVLVVDTSLMNVSISKVVEDLGTTVSGVQGAIALEALVSAAFILIGSKIGDLFGRKRAFVLGLLVYALGALAMTFSQSLTAIILFWAIIGGLGASLLLPAMQSLIHGNFQGAAQKKAYALVGAAAAIAAAVGPLVGGFLTTFLSWRVGFLLEVVVIAVVLSGLGQIRDVP